MNKLKTDIPGKFPFFLDDLRFLDTAYRSAINAVMKAVVKNNNLILWGVEKIYNGGVNFTISEGAVVLNGEILNVEETNINIPIGKIAVVDRDESWDISGLKLFGDREQHNTYQVIKGFVNAIDDGLPPNVIRIATAARLDEIDWETAFDKNTAFNKNFGSSTETVPAIGANLTENQIVETDADKKLITSAKKSAYNKNFGGGAGDVEKGINNPEQLITKTLNIGGWNMDADVSKNVAHGLPDHSKIRSIDAVIFSDWGSMVKLSSSDPGTGIPNGWISPINATNIILYRFTGGQWDGGAYDDATINRGYIKVEYLP